MRQSVQMLIKTAEMVICLSTRSFRWIQQITNEVCRLMRCVNKRVNCVWHPAVTLIHPRCSDTLPKATDYSVPKRQHFAECHLIQASHTPLHSVLSSVSLPHYSSSIFKRKYALFQLVCLGPICHAHYSGPHPPAHFPFLSLLISPLVSVFLPPLCFCD